MIIKGNPFVEDLQKALSKLDMFSPDEDISFAKLERFDRAMHDVMDCWVVCFAHEKAKSRKKADDFLG